MVTGTSTIRSQRTRRKLGLAAASPARQVSERVDTVGVRRLIASRAVPAALREASCALGATRWQAIWHLVLPQAFPGILTGVILAVSRAIGETAPLIVMGALTFVPFAPDGPLSRFTVLPIQIFNWVSRPQEGFHQAAAAAIIVLLALLLTMNAVAVLLRNKFQTRSEG